MERVIRAVSEFWKPCGLVATDHQATLLDAACMLIATLHAHAPVMAAVPYAELTATDYYTGRHPRCALLATVQLLLGLSKSHDNAARVLRHGTAEQILTMPAPAVYAALIDDAAALFAAIMEHPWTVLKVRSFTTDAPAVSVCNFHSCW
jgi:hypothetical protein